MNGGDKHRIVSLVGKSGGSVACEGDVTCACGWTRPYPTIWVAFTMHDVHVMKVVFAERGAVVEIAAKESGN